MEPSSTMKNKRVLWKCDFCRSHKKKCDPHDRVWPGQKCLACEKRGLPCGPNVRSRAYIYTKHSLPGPVATSHNSDALPANQHEQDQQNAAHKLSSSTSGGPKAVFSVPFSQDPDFTGRASELQKLEDYFIDAAEHRQLALSGLGGVGKSQIAIEFAYRARSQGFQYIIWLTATDLLRFEQDCLAAVCALGLENDGTELLYAPTLLRVWLESETDHRWCVIIDDMNSGELCYNAEYWRLLTWSPQPIDLLSFLPHNRNGSILITSESHDVLSQLGHEVMRVNVPSMDQSQALALLDKKLRQPLNDEVACKRLVQLLGYLPLAITQATTYIALRAISLPEYVKRFQQDKYVHLALLDNDMHDPRRGLKQKNSILKLVEKTLNNLVSQAPLAMKLLSQIAVLSYAEIPFSLLFPIRNETSTTTSAIEMLNAYSFIEMHTEKQTITPSHLVQVCARKWLEDHQQVKQRQCQAVDLLLGKLPDSDYFTKQALCRMLLPHVKQTFSYHYPSQYHAARRVELYHRMSCLTASSGQLCEATQILDAAESCKPTLTDRIAYQASILTSRLRACILGKRGQYQQAEKLVDAALRADNDSSIGSKDAANVLRDGTTMVVLRLCQGSIEDAKAIMAVSLEQYGKAFGFSYSRPLATNEALATIELHLHNFDQAGVLYQKVYQGVCSTFPHLHPLRMRTERVANALANLKRVRNRAPLSLEELCKARGVIQLILAAQMDYLDSTHPSILITRNELAVLSFLAGVCNYDNEQTLAAHKLQQETLDQVGPDLGQDHPLTLVLAFNKAKMDLALGNIDIATTELTAVNEICKWQFDKEFEQLVVDSGRSGLEHQEHADFGHRKLQCRIGYIPVVAVEPADYLAVDWVGVMI